MPDSDGAEACTNTPNVNVDTVDATLNFHVFAVDVQVDEAAQSAGFIAQTAADGGVARLYLLDERRHGRCF